jgi:hypothetical protein
MQKKSRKSLYEQKQMKNYQLDSIVDAYRVYTSTGGTKKK